MVHDEDQKTTFVLMTSSEVFWCPIGHTNEQIHNKSYMSL